MSSDKVLRPHYQATARRIRSHKGQYILAIQDQMRLNFTDHAAKSELGLIGKTGKTDQYGLIQHSVLCVDDQNEALGLMDVQFFDYSAFAGVDRSKRTLEEKASFYWIDGLKKMRQRLGDCQKRVITVADREGDFYEFLHLLRENEEAFVIRACHNRCLGFKEPNQEREKLRDVLKNAPVRGSIDVCLQDVDSREIKMIPLSLKATSICFPVPKNMTKDQRESRGYEAISLNVVLAYDADHEWILWTSLPIETMKQIKEVVEIYRTRWHIEDFHKVLKTGSLQRSVSNLGKKVC